MDFFSTRNSSLLFCFGDLKPSFKIPQENKKFETTITNKSFLIFMTNYFFIYNF